MRILVTGGTGFIGSHTVVQLLEANYEVTILDNLSNSKASVIDKIELITGRKPELVIGDIRDYELLDSILRNKDIDAVIHFAGLKAVGESIRIPVSYYDNNVCGTITLLRAMKKYSCKKLVFSSSATVYGMNKNIPFKEGFPLSTTNPYGATKKMIEEILMDYSKSISDLSVVALRYFNPIGAHSSGLIGESPTNIPNNLLPFISKVACGELEFVNVFGDDYDTIDGTGVRDYVHVEDLALGHIKALEYASSNHGYDVFNLGTGIGYSVLQVIEAFMEASKKNVPYKIIARRPGDIGECYADVTKSKYILKWQAKYSLSRMCTDAWRYTQFCNSNN